jgi:hypothetical protein
MDNWRLTAQRVTKYNPDNRDDDGSYKLDEWTSISDIGKEFNGIRFDYQDYIAIEDKYISAILEFCNYFNIQELEIKNLELHDQDTWDKYSLGLKETFQEIKEKRIISKQELENIGRLILREYFWCDLENKDKGIHFGYDYYMYFDTGTKIPEELKNKIREIGLYVD